MHTPTPKRESKRLRAKHLHLSFGLMYFYQQVTQSNYIEIVKYLNRRALKNNINPAITHDIVIVWEDNGLIGKLYVSKELLDLV